MNARATCKSARTFPLLAFLAITTIAGCADIAVFGDKDVYQTQRTAVLAYEAGEDAKAEALYLGLSKVAPNDPEIWLRLGNLYARSNRADDAANAYERSLMLNPNDVRLWYNLGIIRQRQAHAAFIRTNELTDPADPLHQRSEQLIQKVAPTTPSLSDTQESPAVKAADVVSESIQGGDANNRGNAKKPEKNARP